MILRLLALAGAALLGACAGLPPPAPGAQACAATAAHDPRDPRIRRAIDEAHRQHRLFGGQTIERDGGLFRVGHHEAEWDRVAGQTVPAWQRVAAFWEALSGTGSLGLVTSTGRVPLAALAASRADGEPAEREALVRAALVDTPWSAAFISYLMREAGFTAREFRFADNHAGYVRAALEASAAEQAGRPAGHAFRACELATTPPRAGDLLCATRDRAAGTADFGALAAALAVQPAWAGFPMHCDLVVRADGGALDTIGGNVVHSVTLSRMALDAQGLLRADYRAGASADARPHLSRRPWLVLLQLRE